MEGTTTIDISAFTEALTSAIQVSDIVTLMASIVGIGVGFVLAWFGINKAKSYFVRAVTKGRL